MDEQSLTTWDDDDRAAELRHASFECVVPMALVLAAVIAGFLAWNAARLGPRLTPALVAHHAVAIAWYVAVAAAAHHRPVLARVAHGFGLALAGPVVALCGHLAAVTGEALYAAFVGVAVIAVAALVASSAWAAVTGVGLAAAALVAVAAAGAPLVDAAGLIGAAGAIGAAIHLARARGRARLAEARAAERRAARERLDAAVRLAGGLAHDVNNLLCVIGVDAELMTDPHLTDRERAALAAEIADTTARGTAIARQLMAFGRRQATRRAAFAVDAELRRLERVLVRAVGDAVALSISSPPDVAVVADPDQLGQALLNLAINARDAMPGGGRLAIEVDAGPLPEPVRRRHPDTAPGRYVAIAVRDSGAGMDPATAARAFEPYFTTKPTGRGTGLGLSMVHGVVHQHGGVVDLQSAPGAGTCVTLYLPALDEAPATPTAAPSRLALVG